jgi:hypothetical protein
MAMDIKPKNNLTLEEHKLLNGLHHYLETPLYYYGSIQRDDYIPGKSDIDVAIFTDNEKSIMIKMQHYFNVDNDKFKKVLWKIKKQNTIFYGYKLKYENEKQNIHLEFSIYNEKIKDDIIKYKNKNDQSIPFYTTWFLILLKKCHYEWNFIPASLYQYLKLNIFNLLKEKNDMTDQFIILKKY